MVWESETDRKWDGTKYFVAWDHFVFARVEPFDFGVEARAHFLMQFCDAVAVDVVVADFPESRELAPEKECKPFRPRGAGLAFGISSEGGIVSILEGDPLGGDIAAHELVPADGGLSGNSS